MDRWQRCHFKVRERNGCVPGEVAAGVAAGQEAALERVSLSFENFSQHLLCVNARGVNKLMLNFVM